MMMIMIIVLVIRYRTRRGGVVVVRVVVITGSSGRYCGWPHGLRHLGRHECLMVGDEKNRYRNLYYVSLSN